MVWPLRSRATVVRGPSACLDRRSRHRRGGGWAPVAQARTGSPCVLCGRRPLGRDPVFDPDGGGSSHPVLPALSPGFSGPPAAGSSSAKVRSLPAGPPARPGPRGGTGGGGGGRGRGRDASRPVTVSCCTVKGRRTGASPLPRRPALGTTDAGTRRPGGAQSGSTVKRRCLGRGMVGRPGRIRPGREGWGWVVGPGRPGPCAPGP